MAGITIASPAHGQRLYDKGRDEAAQEALKLADEVESGALFEKQLKNLSLLSQQDFATYFLGARRSMRASIDSFATWTEVSAVVNGADNAVTLPASVTAADAEAALADVKAKLAAAAKALDELKQSLVAADDPSTSRILDGLGDLKSLADYADKLAKGIGDEKNRAAITAQSKQIAATLDTLTGLYGRYAERLNNIKKLDQTLDGLKVPVQTVALQALQVDEEHWKTVGAINARREAEQGDIRDIIDDYRVRAKRLGRSEGEKITVTLEEMVKSGNRDGLNDAFLALYGAAALAARGTSPAKLAELRLAQEEHRYSIRRSAIMARAYEVTVSTGVKRLVLYYKGGIKPEQIAQIVQAIATLAIPPAILAR
jgi:hypothetical protein